MTLATLDLLRGSGLSGAGINSIVAVSGAPKGSVYHFFPSGEHGLLAAALKEAEQTVGDEFRRIFSETTPVSQKGRSLFDSTGERAEETRQPALVFPKVWVWHFRIVYEHTADDLR
jgi:TetR/AcrR family transcriptional repressor of lmrAB and yxaGH operons